PAAPFPQAKRIIKGVCARRPRGQDFSGEAGLGYNDRARSEAVLSPKGETAKSKIYTATRACGGNSGAVEWEDIFGWLMLVVAGGLKPVCAP
ncbi:MAG: hypothetical protein ACLFPG_11430, partial [Desulfohalobiaceae bacterium]